MKDRKLGEFLREVSNWRWDKFVRAEKDPNYTSNESMIFALIRSCAMQDMAAIKISLHRLDGKPVTPVQIEYPKVFYLYPNAKLPKFEPKKGIEGGEYRKKTVAKPKKVETPESDLPSLSMRETLTKMSDYPRKLPKLIVEAAELVSQAERDQGEMPENIPMVKSVVAAHLLIMAQNRNIGALMEVFDQIDGKLTETIKMIGSDMYITSFADVAPEGAYLNENGVVEIEAKQSGEIWADRLGRVE